MPVRETLLTNPNAKIILQGKGLPTRPIGAAALELSGSEHPKVLVITTAADNEGDHDKFVAGAREAFAGAEVNVLHGFGQLPTDTQAQHEIGRHDIRWITGGHSQWAKDKMDNGSIIGATLLANIGTGVTGGGSAGHVLLTRAAMSYYTPDEQTHEYIRFDGYGAADITSSPHGDYVEPEGGNTEPRNYHYLGFINADPSLPEPYFSVDHEAGLALAGSTYRVLSAGNHMSGPDMLSDGTPAAVSVFVREHESGLAEVRLMPTDAYLPVSGLPQ
jgi:hypothetical protein